MVNAFDVFANVWVCMDNAIDVLANSWVSLVNALNVLNIDRIKTNGCYPINGYIDRIKCHKKNANNKRQFRQSNILHTVSGCLEQDINHI